MSSSSSKKKQKKLYDKSEIKILKKIDNCSQRILRSKLSYNKRRRREETEKEEEKTKKGKNNGSKESSKGLGDLG